LVAHFKIPHLSTGDILRQAVRDATELGKLAEPIMAASQLVGDELMIGIVRDRLAKPDCANGCLLDGFPRTIAQAEALDAMFEQTGRELDAVLELRVPDEILALRLAGRYAQLDDPRADDRPEAIPGRIETYQRQTQPVLAYYRESGRLKTIDGVGTTDEVFHRICKTLSCGR
jgi:adenylate kinase